jgi:cytochrome c-type biogenesis protein CcmE
MKKKSKKQRIIFIASIFSISLTALIFIIINFKNNLVFFYSPSELKTAHISKNKTIRIGGMIENGSVQNLPNSVLEFTITDFEQSVKIRYQGIKPDLFREGQGTVAKGIWDNENNIFIASELLTKHDEKYMPPEVARSMKRKNP